METGETDLENRRETMKKSIAMVLCLLLAASMLAGCGTEKYDVSGPFSFQESEPVQNVTQVPAPQEAPAEAEPEMPAEVPAADAELPEETAQALLPLSDAELASEAEAAPSEIAAEPEAEPAPEFSAGPAAEEEFGPAGDEITQPYALNGEDDVQRFGSPAEEAEWLDAEAGPYSGAPDAGTEDAEAPFANAPYDDAAPVAAAPVEENPTDAFPVEEEVYEPSEEDLQFAEEVRAQSFAVAMTYWDSGYGIETAPSDPEFGWDALGWYAAWLYRTEQLDLISYESAEAFMQSLGCEGLPFDPAEMMNYGEPRTLRTRDALYFDFGWYKNRIDEVLGVEAGVSVEPCAPQAVDVVVTQHFDGGLQAEKTFTLTYGVNEDPDSEFPWVLRSVTLPELAPEIDPGLTFTWAEVEKANRLENVLALYPAVRMYSSEYPDNGNTWLFVRDGFPALITEGPDYCSGQYRDCWFDYETDEEGVTRARIGAFDNEAGSWEMLSDYLLDGFRDASALRLDRIEDDLIWADCLYRGGYRQKIAFDRGTLVLRELVVLSEEGEVLGSNCYDYSAAEPEYSFLDSWSKELREVAVTWEDYDNGKQTLFSEIISVPADWEYLPYEGRWGDYTVYNNTEYLGEYEYPGDGIDYELFLTTVKG